jgi:hypothetical protein
MVARIATGEIEEADIGSPDLKIRSRKGGEARARSLEPARRTDIATRAAKSRWTGKGSTMTRQTERQTLSERFQAMKAHGELTDMKFFLGKVSETTAEAVCEEVNRLLDNIEDEKVQLLPSWGDSRKEVAA